MNIHKQIPCLEVLVRKQRKLSNQQCFAVNIYGYGRNTGDIDILKIRLLIRKLKDCN
jgi:hypothetical protein